MTLKRVEGRGGTQNTARSRSQSRFSFPPSLQIPSLLTWIERASHTILCSATHCCAVLYCTILSQGTSPSLPLVLCTYLSISLSVLFGSDPTCSSLSYPVQYSTSCAVLCCLLSEPNITTPPTTPHVNTAITIPVTVPDTIPVLTL
jgi:hypothetical protein